LEHHAPRSHTFTPIEGLTQGGSQTILHFRTAGPRRYGDIDYARLLARDLFSKSGFAGTVAADNNAVVGKRADDTLKKPFSVGTMDKAAYVRATVGLLQRGIHTSLSVPVVA